MYKNIFSHKSHHSYLLFLGKYINILIFYTSLPRDWRKLHFIGTLHIPFNVSKIQYMYFTRIVTVWVVVMLSYYANSIRSSLFQIANNVFSINLVSCLEKVHYVSLGSCGGRNSRLCHKAKRKYESLLARQTDRGMRTDVIDTYTLPRDTKVPLFKRLVKSTWK